MSSFHCSSVVIKEYTSSAFVRDTYTCLCIYKIYICTYFVLYVYIAGHNCLLSFTNSTLNMSVAPCALCWLMNNRWWQYSRNQSQSFDRLMFHAAIPSLQEYPRYVCTVFSNNGTPLVSSATFMCSWPFFTTLFFPPRPPFSHHSTSS